MIKPHQISFYSKEINNKEVIKYFKLNKAHNEKANEFYKFCLCFNIYIVYKYKKDIFIYEPYQHKMIAFNHNNDKSTYLEQNNQYINTNLYIKQFLAKINVSYIILDNKCNMKSLNINIPKISSYKSTDINLFNSLNIRRGFIEILKKNIYKYYHNNTYVTIMPNQYAFIKYDEEFTIHDFNQYFKYVFNNDKSVLLNNDHNTTFERMNILELFDDQELSKLNDEDIYYILCQDQNMTQLYYHIIYKLIHNYIEFKEFHASDGLRNIIKYYKKFQNTLRKHNIKSDIFITVKEIDEHKYKLFLINSIHYHNPVKLYHQYSGFNDYDNKLIEKHLKDTDLMTYYNSNSFKIEGTEYMPLDIM